MDDAANEIVVYWRPGCGFCNSLLHQLDKAGVDHRLVNIWEDPDGAAVVRSVARGHETVPTVVIGDVPLVNPSVTQVLAVAVEHAPSAVPDDYEPPEPGRLARWVGGMLAG